MPDATAITELDARTVERIAAGEVVERPASVVKELVENAIDADADRVDVAVESGGTDRIEVRDDGLGMTREGVRRAVREHTTSKISDIDDLEAGVGTLGFRGEALHAIGAVSRLRITTCPRAPPDSGGTGGASQTQSATATELVVEGGEVTDVGPAGRPPGTTVEVTDLFSNVPARRKYLKAESTEFGHVNRMVSGYALANPDVAVTLTHEGREVFATTGSGDRREAVLSVYGREVAASMIAVEPGALPEGPLDGVVGLVSHPETNRASREYLSTFVNGRYVTAGAVRDAAVDAYDAQLAPDRYPFAVLDLAVDPGAVDVNVHPRKLEVRFADEEGVRSQVRAAVNAALMREGLVRTGAPRGRSAPDEASVAPASTDVPADEVEDGDETGGPGGGDSPSARSEDVAVGRETDARTGSPVTDTDSDAGRDRARERDDAETGGARGETDRANRRGREGVGPGPDVAGDDSPTGTYGDAADQAGLGEAEGPGSSPGEFDSLPAMRVLGQFRDTYLVAETADGLVLVDQHAADERVNYERLRAAVDGDVTTQALADPVTVSVTPGEAEVAETRREALARLGFRVSVGDDGLEVRSVPDLGGDVADPALLRDVLADLVRDDGSGAETVEAAADDLLADLACYPSITGNTSLTAGSALALLERLDACENPWACPHGRPTVVVLADDEVEGRFERDYPGH